MIPPPVYNRMPVTPIRPSYGQYIYAGQPPQPVVIQSIELSGYQPGPYGPIPFRRARLDPSQTYLAGACSCGMVWKNTPTRI